MPTIDETHYRLLDLLEESPQVSQRQLAASLGVSLGKLNYCLRALVEKGWVKARRFSKNPNKLQYTYILTPAGLEAKARLTVRFLQRKMQEYDTLQQEITTLRKKLPPQPATRSTQHSSPITQHSSLSTYNLGGADTVTGSCHLLVANGCRILVDCGLAQGHDHALPLSHWPVPPAAIDYLFITHAHLDHCGRLPELLDAGFAGEIITTFATRKLLFPMLADAMALQHVDEESEQRFFARLDELTWGFEYNETFELKNGLRFRLGRAGHILGSAFVLLESTQPPFRILFSGDLGASDTPLLPDPDPPPPCDHLVLESTYGDRLHQGRRDRVQQLGEILTQALADNGKVYIPAFALGRTQEVLYEIDRLRTDPALRQQFPLLHSKKIPVVVDSPLGLTLTEVYEDLRSFWGREARDLLAAGDDPLDFPGLYAARNYRDHLRLAQMDGPAVIIAGSGMCTGGRIVHHLAVGLEDPRNDVIFVGYQAKGTPGRAIQRYAGIPNGYVFLDGHRIPIRARVHTLTGYSAHADQKGLIDWVARMERKPQRITLVHGEAHARRMLGEELRQRGYTAVAA